MDERELFIQAIQVEGPAARGELLRQACGSDESLRQRVDGLLEVHGRAAAFLEAPPLALSDTFDSQPPDLTGTQIGPYMLLELIGEGGMGVVYMAEQQRPVRRLVALKLIKPGMDSKQVIARFEAERQALAMMDHPNIAKVLEAGTAETGRPYFVMELVRGMPLNEFCDHKHLSVRQRLELFIQVCQAVQHAHQKGIIHRDLKPTNVLVTMADATPVPKIIDFGIAKALGQALTEHTLHTGFAQLVGTPLYMSPEQAEMNQLGVDTRSDVYSLGVMLYELLTGATPFDKDTLKDAGFDEMRRIIREVEPPRPSARVSTLAAETRSTVSQRRSADPRRIALALRGELDWIVMRALEKDRARRYESASSLAADIERYLADEPVQACPPSAAYRFAKFARRKKVTLITVALVAAALVMGLVGTAWQAVRATNALHVSDERYQALERAQAQVHAEAKRANGEARRAKTEAAITQAVNDFFNNDVLGQSDPRQQPDRDIKLRAVLDRAAAKIGDRFQGDPLVEAGIRFSLGKTYNSLFDHASAEPQLARAYELRLAALGEEHLDTLQAMNLLAGEYRNQRRFAEAEALYRKSLDIRRRVLGHEHSETLKALNNLSSIYADQGRLAESEPFLREAYETGRRVLGEKDPLTILAMGNLGHVYCQVGRDTEGEALLRKALELHRHVNGAEHPLTLSVMATLANVLSDTGRPSEAEPLLKEALETSRRVQSEDHPHTVKFMHGLANVYYKQQRLAEAAALYESALEKSRRVLGAEHPQTLETINSLARLRYSQGRFADAKLLKLEHVEFARRVLGNDHAKTLASMKNLVLVHLELNELDQAVALLQELHALQQAKLGPADPQTLETTDRLATYLLRQKRIAEAEPLLRQYVDVCTRNHPDDWIGFKLRSLLGGILVHQAQDLLATDQAAAEKKLSEAEPLLLAGYEGMKSRENKLPTPEKRNVRRTLNSLVQLYTEWDKPAEAARWQKELDARTSTAPAPPAPPPTPEP